MAGLVENIRRGVFKISESGKVVLLSNPQKINLKYLNQFPAYLESYGRTKVGNNETEVENEITSTPEEILESNYLKIRKNLALELLSKVKNCSPSFFENLVVDLLVKWDMEVQLRRLGNQLENREMKE